MPKDVSRRVYGGSKGYSLHCISQVTTNKRQTFNGMVQMVHCSTASITVQCSTASIAAANSESREVSSVTRRLRLEDHKGVAGEGGGVKGPGMYCQTACSSNNNSK
jgi:hypothetical protein